MVTIHLKGGLGNQMFQYAYGRAESLRRESRLVIDLTDLLFPLHLRKKETLRMYELSYFKIHAEVCKPNKKHTAKQLARKIWEVITKKERMYQSEAYFKDFEDVIREDLTLTLPLSSPASSMHQLITSSSCPVSVHIRRGDYVSDAITSLHHGALDLYYYDSALKEISSRFAESTFFVFSDDIEWARKHLSTLPHRFIFVTDNIIPSHEELSLMSACSHHIIANSSFSWWGAWLNDYKDKVVIAPKKWFVNTSINTDNIIPKDWMRI